MPRWVAIYVDENGAPRAALITPSDPTAFPFGVDEFAIGLDGFDGEPITLVELPDTPDASL